MISRILLLLLLLIVLPDLYVEFRNRKLRKTVHPGMRLLRWGVTGVWALFTLLLGMTKNFIPDNRTLLDAYLIGLSVFVVPRFLYVVCTVVGRLLSRWHGSATRWGQCTGWILALLWSGISVYGWMFGERQLVVNRIEIESEQLPKAFDGYRIVQWSDAHVGSFLGGRRHLLDRVVDSINAQRADAIVFTGDLQNIQPSEVAPLRGLFSGLKARDGVFSVLGNHDYSMYIDAPDAMKAANERQMKKYQRQMGWDLLLNEHRVIRRGGDSIVIAGEENDGRPPFPSRANLKKTLAGISPSAYVVLLQHDPSAWRRSILPQSDVQLTLSGHTHGGQVSLLGLRPTRFAYPEDKGLYTENGRSLFVSSGIGGLVPFRLGVPPEVVVITLRRK